MELAVYNKEGQETGKTVSLPEEIFGIEPNDHAIYLDVKRIRNAQRAGTHAAKERAAIVGSTKKLKRQKGTGTARAGSIKSPVFRGGGRVFGPRPRNYDIKVNKKVRKLARRSALAHKAQAQRISVIEDLSFEKPRTKEYVKMLEALNLRSYKTEKDNVKDLRTLFVVGEMNPNLELSSRNLKYSKVTTVEQLNTYDVLNAATVLFSESSIEKLSEL